MCGKHKRKSASSLQLPKNPIILDKKEFERSPEISWTTKFSPNINESLNNYKEWNITKIERGNGKKRNEEIIKNNPIYIANKLKLAYLVL